MPPQQPPKRFYSLDVARGLAALSVVFWHWQHFFYQGTQLLDWRQQAQPFWSLLSILYLKGHLGVDFFFSLSGFVFYWLYSSAVSEKRISPWRFALLRFSRLYPLHFASLLSVAIGQFLFQRATGNHFIYPFNDVWHFVLNVFFVSGWGLQTGYSFNAPIWSVSVEVLLYALFFLACRALPVRLWLVLVLSVLGVALQHTHFDAIGRGIASFFLGGFTYLMYQRALLSGAVSGHVRHLPFLTILLWAVSLYVFFRGDPVFRGAGLLSAFWAPLFLFPLTILTLAVLETRRGRLGRRFAWLGDISYATYLLHFPLQLFVMLLWSYFGLDRELFYSPGVMAAFFLLLIALSRASHRYFELPIQNALRSCGTKAVTRQRTIQT